MATPSNASTNFTPPVNGGFAAGVATTEGGGVSSLESFAQQAGAVEDPLERWFYDAGRRHYITKNSRGGFQSLDAAQLRRRLKMDGVSSHKDMLGVTGLDRMQVAIEQERDVSYAGPLAGYQAGILEIGGRRVLVTENPNRPEGVEGEYPNLQRFFFSLLGEEQVRYFYGWAKQADAMYCAGRFMPGQALAFAGGRGDGKSLAQAILTEFLGGRCARPHAWLTGATAFNNDLFGAEHLMIEDDTASTDARARRHLGAMLKSVAVNVEHRLEAKGRDALMLRPLWRLTISCNDEPENLAVLPILDASLLDKITMFKTNHADLPSTSTADQRRELWETLTGELPAFLYWIRQWEIPVDIQDSRFGVIAYQHPELIAELDELAPEIRLLRLIDAHILNELSIWTGTAGDLESVLTSGSCAYEARKLLNWSNATGTYLGRLAQKHPERFEYIRTDSARTWRIKS